MNIKWSQEQQKAIYTKNKDIIISAAAGAGKTAVLAERVIAMITDHENPVDVDQLLIMTFTNAAATEMRYRIMTRLDELIQTKEDKERYISQKMLLPSAQISTIHSFCLRLVKEHFNELGVNPSFRIIDSQESAVIRDDTLKLTLENAYSSNNTDFLELVEQYSGGITDTGIEKLILDVYMASQSHPWPKVWFELCIQQCKAESSEKSFPFIQKIMDESAIILTRCIESLNCARLLINGKDGLSNYQKIIDSDNATINQLLQIKSYTKMQDTLKSVKWDRIPRTSKMDEDIKEQFLVLRSSIKISVQQLKTEYFATSLDRISNDMHQMGKSIGMIRILTETFEKNLKKEKHKRHVLEFSDLEHYALELLAERITLPSGKSIIKPTHIAKELGKKYTTVICDEYQDSNLLQETIMQVISQASSGCCHRFMVGDAKQSIYRFRQADADIFLKKMQNYAVQHNAEKIILNQNYRSRSIITATVNDVFENIMSEETCGIPYDSDSRLYTASSFPEDTDADISNTTDIILVDSSDLKKIEEDISEVELEAKAVAGKIKSLVSQLDIMDKQTGLYRKAQYGDITILLRTINKWSDVFLNILTSEGIPTKADMSTGFFDTAEIRALIALLDVIDNPRQDIPLAAVLLSPVFGLSQTEIALARSKDKDVLLIDSCTMYASEHPESRLTALLAEIAKFRNCMNYMTAAELIDYIFAESGYEKYFLSLPAGKKRIANVNRLSSMAKAHSDISAGLFSFLRYIHRLLDTGSDYGECSDHDNSHDFVQIMSIHKSKGLEFPIVILSGIGKRFNMQDSRKTLLTHPRYGIGIDIINPVQRTRSKTAYKKYISHMIKNESLAEEMRVLYVALTRAKEKLILTGTINGLDRKIEKWKQQCTTDTQATPSIILSAQTYADWILPAVYKSFEINKLRYTVICKDIFSLRTSDLQEISGNLKRQDLFFKMLETMPDDADLYDVLTKDASWLYKDFAKQNLFAKYTVSALNSQHCSSVLTAEDAYVTEILPDFMLDNTEIPQNGAAKGSAYHHLLEKLDMSLFTESVLSDKTLTARTVQSAIEQMKNTGKLAQEETASINHYAITDFLISEIGRLMINAFSQGNLYREQQFMVQLPAYRLFNDQTDIRTFLLQGIIDAFIITDEGIILIDYKTDILSTETALQTLTERYGMQMHYYKTALEQITGKKVLKSVLYSFSQKKSYILL